MFLRRLFRFISSRGFILGILLLVQLALILSCVVFLNDNYVLFSVTSTFISIIIVLALINNQEENPSTKLAWIIVIMLLPIVGAAIYIMFGSRYASRHLRSKVQAEIEKSHNVMPSQQKIMGLLAEYDAAAASQCQYLLNVNQIPPLAAKNCRYFASGEELFPELLQELKKAQRYIFIESFIIQEGVFWNNILAVLQAKAAQGVDVRIVFDDVGCLQTLPYNYHKTLEAMGIKCAVFNPIKLHPDTGLNNRDHRKIIIIDGQKAMVGGINLADEYINQRERFGYWKDSALLFDGDAVAAQTLIFLQNWNLSAPERRLDYQQYCSQTLCDVADYKQGFIQPFYDTPLDGEHIGESVFMNMINSANEYIYINTPYFIVDNELLMTLQLAAKRGVDVRICTPHIPDKWYVHMMTQAYYQPLQKAGIKVVEFEPGFNHTKSIVADDKYAFVGTINCDYRSFYHHFECGVLLYGVQNVINAMKEDFLATEKLCIPADRAADKTPLLLRILRSLLRLFAPLM